MGSQSSRNGIPSARRASIAALLSAVIPSWGHAYTGRRTLARALLRDDVKAEIAELLAGFAAPVPAILETLRPDTPVQLGAENIPRQLPAPPGPPLMVRRRTT